MAAVKRLSNAGKRVSDFGLRVSDGLVSRTLSIARAYSDDLDETERGLEEEIRRESHVPPPERKLARLRHNGVVILHSKHVLLTIVILNLIDCALVLGELMLDIHYIKELREASLTNSQSFLKKMELRYPNDLYDFDIDHMGALYDKIYQADCYWNHSKAQINENSEFQRKRRTVEFVNQTDSVGTINHPEYSIVQNMENVTNDSHNVSDAANRTHHHQQHHNRHHHEHSIWEEIAHGMHKASICILGILFVENIFKVLCMGRGFFVHKLEVFDAVIVIVSFIVDLVFLKGLSGYSVQNALLILSFLLPWRVIRVVNSLIVAVLDHEHFRLKMLYQEKKAISQELKILKQMEKKWDFHLHKIEQFCESEGIPKWKIRQHTAMGRKQSTITSMASLALSGLLTGLLDTTEDHAMFARSISLKSKTRTNHNNPIITVTNEDEQSEDKSTTNGSRHESAMSLNMTEPVNHLIRKSNSDESLGANNSLKNLHLEKKRVSFDAIDSRQPLLRRQASVDDATIEEEDEEEEEERQNEESDNKP